jgi:MYXO-CTERM domain-containing protein
VLSGSAPALTYTPNANAHGPDSFTFKVNDGQVDSAIATVSIAIASVDDAPVLAPVGDQSVAVGGTLALTVSAADVDGDAVVLSVDGLPAGATFTAATGAFSWTPAGGDVGDHTVTFTASDGALTDSETVVLAVTSSRPPDSEATGCGCRGGDGGGASLLFLAALVLLGSARRSHRPRPRAPEMASWTTRGE